MLELFETFSVDTDIWASIRNVQADFRNHVTSEIRWVIAEHDKLPLVEVTPELILADGELVRLPGSDITHFVYRGVPLLAWTNPKMEVAGVTRVHLTYRIGVMAPVSEETKRFIAEAP